VQSGQSGQSGQPQVQNPRAAGLEFYIRQQVRQYEAGKQTDTRLAHQGRRDQPQLARLELQRTRK